MAAQMYAVNESEWELHKPMIIDLYQGNRLKDVAAILRHRKGFRATERMYKGRLKKWGVSKNRKRKTRDDRGCLSSQTPEPEPEVPNRNSKENATGGMLTPESVVGDLRRKHADHPPSPRVTAQQSKKRQMQHEQKTSAHPRKRTRVGTNRLPMPSPGRGPRGRQLSWPHSSGEDGQGLTPSSEDTKQLSQASDKTIQCSSENQPSQEAQRSQGSPATLDVTGGEEDCSSRTVSEDPQCHTQNCRQMVTDSISALLKSALPEPGVDPNHAQLYKKMKYIFKEEALVRGNFLTAQEQRDCISAGQNGVCSEGCIFDRSLAVPEGNHALHESQSVKLGLSMVESMLDAFDPLVSVGVLSTLNQLRQVDMAKLLLNKLVSHSSDVLGSHHDFTNLVVCLDHLLERGGFEAFRKDMSQVCYHLALEIYRMFGRNSLAGLYLMVLSGCYSFKDYDKEVPLQKLLLRERDTQLNRVGPLFEYTHVIDPEDYRMTVEFTFFLTGCLVRMEPDKTTTIEQVQDFLKQANRFAELARRNGSRCENRDAYMYLSRACYFLAECHHKQGASAEARRRLEESARYSIKFERLESLLSGRQGSPFTRRTLDLLERWCQEAGDVRMLRDVLPRLREAAMVPGDGAD